METETYKNAKLILERFDPEAKKKAVSAFVCFFASCVCLVLCLIISLLCLTSVGFIGCYVVGAGVDSSASSDDSQTRTRYDTHQYKTERSSITFKGC